MYVKTKYQTRQFNSKMVALISSIKVMNMLNFLIESYLSKERVKLGKIWIIISFRSQQSMYICDKIMPQI